MLQFYSNFSNQELSTKIMGKLYHTFLVYKQKGYSLQTRTENTITTRHSKTQTTYRKNQRRRKKMVKVMWVSVLALAAAILLVTVAKIPVAEGVTCSPTELYPCAAAMTSSSPPSETCCAKLREQKPCFCGYMRNANLRQYISSPNARKVSNSCNVAPPSC